MAKFIELSAEETIRTAELIGKALGFPYETNGQAEQEKEKMGKKEAAEDGSH